MATPSDEVIFWEYLYIDCEVEIQGRKLLSDLVILKIISFDVILGIDWLLRNYALMDYWNQKIIFKPVRRQSLHTIEMGYHPRQIFSYPS